MPRSFFRRKKMMPGAFLLLNFAFSPRILLLPPRILLETSSLPPRNHLCTASRPGDPKRSHKGGKEVEEGLAFNLNTLLNILQ